MYEINEIMERLEIEDPAYCTSEQAEEALWLVMQGQLRLGFTFLENLARAAKQQFTAVDELAVDSTTGREVSILLAVTAFQRILEKRFGVHFVWQFPHIIQAATTKDGLVTSPLAVLMTLCHEE